MVSTNGPSIPFFFAHPTSSYHRVLYMVTHAVISVHWTCQLPFFAILVTGDLGGSSMHNQLSIQATGWTFLNTSLSDIYKGGSYILFESPLQSWWWSVRWDYKNLWHLMNSWILTYDFNEPNTYLTFLSRTMLSDLKIFVAKGSRPIHLICIAVGQFQELELN